MNFLRFPHNRTIRTLLLTVLATALTPLLQAETEKPHKEPFRDIQWKLIVLIHEGDDFPLPDNAHITLTIDSEGKAFGSSGVNQYGGNIEITKDGKCAWGEDLMGTLMAGEPELMKTESQYLTALRITSQLTLADDRKSLTLANEDESTKLVYTPADKDASADE